MEKVTKRYLYNLVRSELKNCVAYNSIHNKKKAIISYGEALAYQYILEDLYDTYDCGEGEKETDEIYNNEDYRKLMDNAYEVISKIKIEQE